MPLNLRVPNPSAYAGAVLPAVPTVAEVINGVAGLVGLWDPGTVADGAVEQLAPSFGPTTLLRSGAGVNKATVGGLPAITFDAANTRLAASWAAAGSPATAIMQFYIRETSADFQNFFGPSGAPRLIYRSSGTIQWAGTSQVNGITISPPLIGWHLAEIYVGASTARIIIDGHEYTAAQAGNGNTALMFGTNPGAGNNTSIALGKMFAANSDLYGTTAAQTVKMLMGA